MLRMHVWMLWAAPEELLKTSPISSIIRLMWLPIRTSFREAHIQPLVSVRQLVLNRLVTGWISVLWHCRLPKSTSLSYQARMLVPAAAVCYEGIFTAVHLMLLVPRE